MQDGRGDDFTDYHPAIPKTGEKAFYCRSLGKVTRLCFGQDLRGFQFNRRTEGDKSGTYWKSHRFSSAPGCWWN